MNTINLNKMLNEVAIKYDLTLDNKINKEVLVIKKATDVIGLVSNKDEFLRFYDLNFFKTKTLESIGTAKNVDEVEKILFNIIFNKKNIKLTTNNLELLKNFDNKIKFSYTIIADLIIKELFLIGFKNIYFTKIVKKIDKENKNIKINFYKDAKDASCLNNNNVLTLVYDINNLFSKNGDFLSKIELNSNKINLKYIFNSLIEYVNSEKYSNSEKVFKKSYVENKNKFIME